MRLAITLSANAGIADAENRSPKRTLWPPPEEETSYAAKLRNGIDRSAAWCFERGKARAILGEPGDRHPRCAHVSAWAALMNYPAASRGESSSVLIMF
jgi:hypothetical protein